MKTVKSRIKIGKNFQVYEDMSIRLTESALLEKKKSKRAKEDIHTIQPKTKLQCEPAATRNRISDPSNHAASVVQTATTQLHWSRSSSFSMQL